MPTLNWVGKDEVLNHNPAYYTLEKKYTFNSKNDTSENMIIKGDNLLALKALLPQYENKIKCIYIDPPYNTGNENWVYNDNVNSPKIKKWLGEVVAKDDLSRHDKWLCMMLPRLKLLHRLLSDDGVIFISIDDNEMANLKLLCDEIFGLNNFIDVLHWKRKKQPSFLAKHTAKVMEYVIVYAKNWNNLGKLSIETLSDATKKVINLTNQNSIRHFNSGVRVKCFNNGVIDKGIYTIKTMSIEYLNDVIIKDGKTINEVDVKALFCVSQEKIDKYIKENLLYITANKSLRRDISEDEKNNKKAITDLLLDWGDNQDSEKELKEILDYKVFDYSKPKLLISNLIQSATDKNSIILDSFAGSGTTAHAVLELNKKDGGNRKFILVEMEDYAENITAERVKRVIKGYGKEPENSATGGDFSFYELGDRLIEENGNINENISIEKIREYIYFSETKEKCEQKGSDFLGECNGVAYYFIYKKDDITTLDFEYLAKLKKAISYVIYADVCVLSNETMMKYNITFKKIPRDIKKV
ncbi:MAG: site-specific DNA-methyltransferase [Campylobacter sp.]|nr:site-specific DNA-methyltransferase [Campylobacter sp.]